MRLGPFILANLEPILADWEAFAGSLLPGAGMTRMALRDHGQPILEAVAADLATAQTREQQAEKSKGRVPKIADAPETAAQTHAVLRAGSGFDITHLVAEYRALRASVLRRWLDSETPGPDDLQDMLRFNEAIDQAIAESIGHFDLQVERARNLLLGMLGHDMQSPLTSILVTARHLQVLNAGEQVSAAGERLIRSGRSMQGLLDDLVSFNRTRLGLGVNIDPVPIDLGYVVADEVQQLRAVHAPAVIDVEASGDVRGAWDAGRLQQVVRNLVSNAVRHGDARSPIRVSVRGDADEVRLEVRNKGAALEAGTLAHLFEPLQRGESRQDPAGEEEGLGLGLYIVQAIARAHGGEAAGRSEGGETIFSVRLPRTAPLPRAAGMDRKE